MVTKNFHHTDADALDLNRSYNQTFFKKPLGLWYDVDGSWEKYLVNNMEYPPSKNHFLMDIDKSRMIIINTIEQLNAFTKEFYEVVGDPKWNINFIIWSKVAEKYSGIEIRLTEKIPLLEMVGWFQGWDVASGCIWDLSIIKSVTKTNYGEQIEVKQGAGD